MIKSKVSDYLISSAILGYREITAIEGNFLLAKNLKAKGHEFHYSTFVPKTEIPYAYYTKGMQGLKKRAI